MSVLVFAYVLTGLAIVVVMLDRREARELAENLVAVALWPVVLVLRVVGIGRRRRRELARQDRISVRVAAGELDADFARRFLNWKGPR